MWSRHASRTVPRRRIGEMVVFTLRFTYRTAGVDWSFLRCAKEHQNRLIVVRIQCSRPIYILHIDKLTIDDDDPQQLSDSQRHINRLNYIRRFSHTQTLTSRPTSSWWIFMHTATSSSSPLSSQTASTCFTFPAHLILLTKICRRQRELREWSLHAATTYQSLVN